MVITIIIWWRDVIREATYLGDHSSFIIKSLRFGIILFITSEVIFFFGFFWAFFHSALAPVPQVGGLWPPQGVNPLNPFSIPLLNTILLLSRGARITWAHHELQNQNLIGIIKALWVTIFYGVLFTLLQGIEYFEAPFSIADSVYGSVFFIATGFHGLHVLIGTSFLCVCLYRCYYRHFSPGHHFGFEAAAWYWHFVDVVWICLYIIIYCWGS